MANNLNILKGVDYSKTSPLQSGYLSNDMKSSLYNSLPQNTSFEDRSQLLNQMDPNQQIDRAILYQGDPDLAQFGSSPYASPLRDAMSSGSFNIKAPSSTFTPDAYKAKDMSSSALPQYDAMRTRLNTQYSQNQAQSQDALDRQFAAAGGGPGNGAQAKQTENLAAGIAKQKGDDLAGINAQEAQTRTELQNQENQKEFQSGESQKGMGFQSQQADLGRQFEAGQFNASNLMTGLSSIAGLDSDWAKAQAESRNNEFNKQLAMYTQRHSGGLFGSGGFLGTGLGA